MIVDQESWDKINVAADEGRRFQEGGREGSAGVDVGLDGSKDRMRTDSEEVSPGKKASPKRKVVRAGDETETDVGGRKT